MKKKMKKNEKNKKQEKMKKKPLAASVHRLRVDWNQEPKNDKRHRRWGKFPDRNAQLLTQANIIHSGIQLRVDRERIMLNLRKQKKKGQKENSD